VFGATGWWLSVSFGLSVEAVSMLSHFRFGLLGVLWVGVEGAFRAAGLMCCWRGRGRPGPQPGADHAGVCVPYRVDHGV